MVDETVVRKIKKLLALAENQVGTSEGELAAAFAARMMVEHAGNHVAGK